MSCKSVINPKGTAPIIPEPQKVKLHTGHFAFPENLIMFSDQKTESRQFALNLLLEEMQLQSVPAFDEKDANFIVKRYEADSKDHNKNRIGSQGYFLKIKPNKIILQANTETGIFYGIQSLRQLFRYSRRQSFLPCLTIIDWPALPYRGWQDDISRGPIPTMDFLKRQIRTMAEYKQNVFTLYTEHVFKLKNHPKIAPEDGLSREEIKELVDYAKSFHIEVIGNFQSFGHFHNILKLPEYSSLGETEAGWVLSPAIEESYHFLKDVYDEIAPAYESDLFNINCDETWGLGQGASAGMVDSMGLEGVYAYHINRIDKLLKSHGKRIMMWGDIAVSNPDIISKLPKDLIVLSWGYDPRESFDDVILPFTKLGFDFMVCPGVNCWSRVWPNHESAIINISNYIRDGFHHGALGVLNTTWDDDGENLYNNNWYPLIWSAECSWKPIPYNDKKNKMMKERLKKFQQNTNSSFFGHSDEDIAGLLVRLDDLGAFAASRNMLNKHFWQEISAIALSEISQEEEKENQVLLREAEAIINAISLLKKNDIFNSDILDYAEFATERIVLIAKKHLLGTEMSKALHSGPGDMEQFSHSLDQLAVEVMNLKYRYKNLWLQENRQWWLDTNLVKYDELAEDLRRSYLNVLIEPQESIKPEHIKIELKKLFQGGEIFYTLDGQEPGPESMRYTNPFEVKEESLIRAVGFLNNHRGKEAKKTVHPHLALGKSITLRNNYHPNYPGGGINGLINGEFGSSQLSDGKWQGYEGVDLDAVIDLGKTMGIKSISTKFLQSVDYWVFHPEKIIISLSNDNQEFEELKNIDYEIHENIPRSIIQEHKVDTQKNARYVRVYAKNIGHCPVWHVGEKGLAWIFIDEIVIK
ncbi:MAG: family 20 glycosylhydrolase [Candidatus Marinimicrobia bacterium]|nr:family 20 glycosylhydrolase [Candidatus Neomarinimicrobiota bacterium]